YSVSKIFFCSNKCRRKGQEIVFLKDWEGYPEQLKDYVLSLWKNKDSRKLMRIRAMKKIDPRLKCVECGCDAINFLDINHKNGGGGKEYSNIGNVEIYRKILNGERSVDDLELLCKVCNKNHWLRLRGMNGIVVRFIKHETNNINRSLAELMN